MQKRSRTLTRLKSLGLIMITGVLIFQLGLGACLDATAYLNPCGTFFTFCSATDVDRLREGTPGYGFDWGCTVIGACGDIPPGPAPEGLP